MMSRRVKRRDGSNEHGDGLFVVTFWLAVQLVEHVRN